jgi:hypothetical protein
MAPEAIEGQEADAHDISPSAQVLHEMVTG